MSAEAETSQPRSTGDAAYKAEIDATAQRNAVAKRSAAEHKSPTDRAREERERRLDRVEAAQLNALNTKLATQRRKRAT